MRDFAKLLITLTIGILILVPPTLSYAQDEMSMEEYQRQLAEWQKREADANAEIATVNTEIDSLRGELNSLDSQVASEWDDIYEMLGTDKAGVDAFRSDLKNIESQVDGLMAISPEELFSRRAEIDDLQAKLDEKKNSNIALLTEMQDLIATIEGKITQLRAKMPKASFTEYNVMKGDYLWRISGKGDIYGDPYQWMRIYSYNRDQIKDPDLIYPDQVFKIQRDVGPDEILVSKGDFLAKIAGSTNGGDPSLWRKLYEANKDIIGDDPSMIYPYTVLRLPK